MTTGSETEHQRKIGRHGLFVRHVSVICIFVMMFMFILTGCSTSADQEKDAAGETSIIPIENETDGSADTVIELSEDTDPGINELFTTYFADLAKGDVKALGKIMVNAPDKDTVAKESEYIEDYQNIKCYSKKGILDDTYVVYVYYEVKFRNIDTLAPSMIREYVCTNEDGTLYINNGEVSGEVASWLEEVQASDSAQKLVDSVNEALTEAASSDKKLYELIAKLNEGAGTVASAEESSAEETTAKKESEQESKETESSKEETTKAETEKETTKAAETTAKETEYKAFDKKKTMYAQENLNIRKKASADSKLMGKLIAGDSITALGTTGKWTVVSYKGGKAYILSELLGKKKPDLGVSFKSVDETVEATQNVRMRKQPDANAEVAGTLPGGTKVTRTGYDSKWSRIVYNGKTVYVASEYLQK
ncbi:MAG: SH3 domain-containing protein [Lachnospiraceae bacterium]